MNGLKWITFVTTLVTTLKTASQCSLLPNVQHSTAVNLVSELSYIYNLKPFMPYHHSQILKMAICKGYSCPKNINLCMASWSISRQRILAWDITSHATTKNLITKKVKQ